jgi:hypothetical protein
VICFKTKGGTAWFAQAFDSVRVTNPAGRSFEFTVDELEGIMVDTAGGQLATLEARRPDGGSFEVLQITDGETGTPVKLLFEPELFRQVGAKMAEPRIAPASASDIARFS